MKKIITVAICIVALCGALNAQQPNTHAESLPIAVVAASSANIPESCKPILESKLMQILTNNGIGSVDYSTQFLITATLTPLTKDVVSGPPAQYAFTENLTFYIVDNQSKTIFSSMTYEAKGVDVSEEKAIINAIRSVRTSSKEFKSFVNAGREKILSYYEINGQLIIDKASSLARMKNYEESLYLLSTIPMTSKWFSVACDVAAPIYDQYADIVSEENLAKAKSAWYSSQNIQGAKESCAYLSLITPDMSAYIGAQSLYAEIKSRVKDIVEYPWKLHNDKVSLESQKIEAWRAVGVAYGQNQKSSDNNLVWLVK